jgi:hypothetical protein
MDCRNAQLEYEDGLPSSVELIIVKTWPLGRKGMNCVYLSCHGKYQASFLHLLRRLAYASRVADACNTCAQMLMIFLPRILANMESDSPQLGCSSGELVGNMEARACVAAVSGMDFR